MKERPILFNGPMVRAILDGSKTQTRRIVKPGKDHFTGCELAPCELAGEVNNGDHRNSPYGYPDDRLYVRETWAQPTTLDPGPTFYRADYPDCVPHGTKNILPVESIKWKPSIHMPRAASRIDLLINAVRVERLQDISEADCWAEGIEQVDGMLDDLAICNMAKHMGLSFEDPAPTFAALWESINGAGSWEANPWVWVVSFERVKP